MRKMEFYHRLINILYFLIKFDINDDFEIFIRKMPIIIF